MFNFRSFAIPWTNVHNILKLFFQCFTASCNWRCVCNYTCLEGVRKWTGDPHLLPAGNSRCCANMKREESAISCAQVTPQREFHVAPWEEEKNEIWNWINLIGIRSSSNRAKLARAESEVFRTWPSMCVPRAFKILARGKWSVGWFGNGVEGGGQGSVYLTTVISCIPGEIERKVRNQSSGNRPAPVDWVWWKRHREEHLEKHVHQFVICLLILILTLDGFYDENKASWLGFHRE